MSASFLQQIGIIGFRQWRTIVRAHVLDRLVPINWHGFARTDVWPGYWHWFWNDPDGGGFQAFGDYRDHVRRLLCEEPVILRFIRGRTP